MDDCIFCKIASGEIPASIVYSDDEFVAFDDIAPQGPIHALVIPRHHYRNLRDGVPADLMGRLCTVVGKVAEMKDVVDSGYRVIVNNGPDAGQEVDHLHVHVIGGGRMAAGLVSFAP